MDARLADPDEQVLAAADDLVDPLPGQVYRGVSRHANIAARQRFTDQRLAQLGGGVEDGVTLGHIYPVILSETSHSRSALAGSSA